MCLVEHSKGDQCCVFSGAFKGGPVLCVQWNIQGGTSVVCLVEHSKGDQCCVFSGTFKGGPVLCV